MASGRVTFVAERGVLGGGGRSRPCSPWGRGLRASPSHQLNGPIASARRSLRRSSGLKQSGVGEDPQGLRCLVQGDLATPSSEKLQQAMDRNTRTQTGLSCFACEGAGLECIAACGA